MLNVWGSFCLILLRRLNDSALIFRLTSRFTGRA